MSLVKKTGFTLVEIMIVVAVIALLAAIAIPNLMRAQVLSYEANAKANLKTLSTALEMYAADTGAYPSIDSTGFALLTEANPPYLSSEVSDKCFSGTHNGYRYTCAEILSGGYFLDARPSSFGTANQFPKGAKRFVVSMGGAFEEYSSN